MTYIVAGNMFKDEHSALTAVQYEMVLEKWVNFRAKLPTKLPGQNLLFQTIENRAVPMIWETQQALNPKIFESVQEMDAHVLWRIYWRSKYNPVNKNMLFLSLLAEINKNPPFAIAFG